MNIKTVIEKKRGCGYRKPGGIYLCMDGIGKICGALPIELTVCPTCHHGIKPARGWTWINIADLVEKRGCYYQDDPHKGCGNCPIADAQIQMAGLLWVGEKFYKTPGDFATEASEMGISRRISMVPRGFTIGETWVALAHRRAIATRMEAIVGEPIKESEFKPGIFHIFKPSRLEYIVKEFDPQDKLEKLEKRGITLVKVKREQTEMKEVLK